METCLIALGGNLHNSRQAFTNAMAQLERRGCSVIEMSRLKQTRPVGSEAGHDFLNAAATLQTDVSPEELLTTLHEIETLFGRTRTLHWGPRTLDLDLILYGEFVSNVPHLVVPHPAMWYRRFVLDPAIEVAAEMIHPILGKSISQLREQLSNYPLVLELCAVASEMNASFCEEVLNSVRDLSSHLQWQAVESASVVSPDAFARIIARRQETRPGIQPLNEAGREVVITGETVTEIVSQIEHLTTAILG